MSELNPLRLFAAGYAATLLLLVIWQLPRAHRYCMTRLSLRAAPPEIFRALRPAPQRFLGLWQVPEFAPTVTLAFGIVLSVSLVLSLVFGGHAVVRACFALASLASALFFSQLPDLNTVRRKANTVPVVLFVLATATGVADAWSARPDAWPLFAICVLLVQVYFSAAVEKLRSSGLRWADGHVLHWAMIQHWLWSRERVPAMRLPSVFLRAGSTAALLLEAASPLALASRVSGCAFALVGLSLHVTTSFALSIHYFFIYPTYCAVLALLFGAATPIWTDAYGIVFVYVLAGLLVAVTLARRRFWPFDIYPMYSAAPPAPIVAHRLAIDHRDARVWWWCTPLSNDLERISQLLDQWAVGDATTETAQPIVTAALSLAAPGSDATAVRIVRRAWDSGALVETSVATLPLA